MNGGHSSVRGISASKAQGRGKTTRNDSVDRLSEDTRERGSVFLELKKNMYDGKIAHIPEEYAQLDNIVIHVLPLYRAT